MPTETPPKQENTIFTKKKLLWAILFILIAAGSIWAVAAQSKDFSLRDMADYIGDADWLPVLCAIFCMLGYIFFEGCALRCACLAFRQKCGIRQGLFYAASDIYFSAITPSATGGQPACAFFMISDGMPTVVSAIALVANLLMYTLSIIVIGAVGFLARPEIFLSFGTLSKVLILAGCALQVGLFVLFVVLLRETSFLHRICSGLLHFLAKIHLIRHEDRKQAKLKKMMIKYKEYSLLLEGHRTMMAKTFLYNFLQRALLIAVTAFAFVATGGASDRAFDIFVLQSYVVLGSNCVPIPGAMGVSDYLLLDGLEALGIPDAAHLDLFSRGLSFYSCILICGIAVFVKYWLLKKRRVLS